MSRSAKRRTNKRIRSRAVPHLAESAFGSTKLRETMTSAFTGFESSFNLLPREIDVFIFTLQQSDE